MSQLNPSIILAGQPVNALNALSQGIQTGHLGNQVRRANDREDLFREHGAGIMAGETNALNALAGMDPQAALGVRQSQQQMRHADERMQLARAAGARAAAEASSRMSAAELAAGQEQIKKGLAAAVTAQTPEQWDLLAREFGAADLVGQFDQKDALIAYYTGLDETLGRMAPKKPDVPASFQALHARALGAGLAEGTPEYQEFMLNNGQMPQPEGPADEYQRYVAEEQAAGRMPLSRIDYAQAKKGKGVVVRGPDGTEITVGGPAGATQSALSPSSPEAMISSIDGIINDPALSRSTGIFKPLQSVPGTPQRRVGARINQLEGQAFLQAFESLKGGGQITEIEGQKATQAIGRLDSAQSAEDYTDALTELRSILVAGVNRPKGWVQQQRGLLEGQELYGAAEIKGMTPDQIRALGPGALTRIPVGQLSGLTSEQWDALESLAGE